MVRPAHHERNLRLNRYASFMIGPFKSFQPFNRALCSKRSLRTAVRILKEKSNRGELRPFENSRNLAIIFLWHHRVQAFRACEKGFEGNSTGTIKSRGQMVVPDPNFLLELAGWTGAGVRRQAMALDIDHNMVTLTSRESRQPSFGGF